MCDVAASDTTHRPIALCQLGDSPNSNSKLTSRDMGCITKVRNVGCARDRGLCTRAHQLAMKGQVNVLQRHIHRITSLIAGLRLVLGLQGDEDGLAGVLLLKHE